MENEEFQKSNKFFYALSILATLLALFILVGEVIIALVMSSEIAGKMFEVSLGLYLLLPKPTVVVTIGSPLTLVYFIFLLSCILISFAILLGKYLENQRMENGRPVWSTVIKSPLTDVAKIAGMILFLNILIVMVAGAITGKAPESPDFSGYAGWDLALSFMQATVWEELLCRVCFSGLPLLIIAYISGEREDLKKYIIGGFEFNKIVLVFLLISSFIFGYAHLGSWGLWKIVPTFLFGLGAGYLFYRHGLYAAISLHFLIDFVDAERFSGLGTPFLTIMFLIIAFAGIFFLIELIKKGIDYMRGDRSKQTL